MKKSALLAVFILIVVTTPVFAQSTLTSPTTKQTIREAAEQRKEAVKDALSQARLNAKATITQAQDTFKAKREEIKDSIVKRQEERKAALLQKREEVKKAIQLKKEAFKEKIATLKDERKKAIAERFDNKLSSVNVKFTDTMNITLEKLDALLARIIEKAQTAKTNGQDTAVVDAAITTAQNAIAAAQTAVTTQAGKDYTATVTSETALKQNMGTAMSQLRADLESSKKTVTDAKQAVRKAAEELSKLRIETVISPTVGL